MLFAVDIGNTNIHVGFFRSGELLHSFRIGSDSYRTSDEYALLLKAMTEFGGYALRDFNGGIVGSVVPSVTAVVRAALSKLIEGTILTVGPGIKTGFSIKVDNPSELGADLAANTAGAIVCAGAPVLVVDFGTATTLSVVDRGGAYIGCSILPGIRMSLDALRSAELLPGVPDDASVPILGRNSADSMRSGVIRGQALAVSGWIEAQKKAQKLPKDVPVLVTGGYAEPLLPYLPASAVYVPELTLKGLNVIYHKNTDG